MRTSRSSYKNDSKSPIIYSLIYMARYGEPTLTAGARLTGAGLTSPLRRLDAARLKESRATLAIASAVLYYVAAEAGIALQFPDSGASIVWPPNGVLVAVLMLAPVRRWWIVLAAAVPAHLCAMWDVGFPWWRLLWQLLHNFSLALSVSAALRVLTADRDPFACLRDFLSYLLVAAVLAPAVAAVMAPPTVVSLFGMRTESADEAWLRVALSSSLALLAFAPLLYVWLPRGHELLRRARPWEYAEALLIAAALYGVYALLFVEGAGRHAPLYLFPIPFLWAAARFGVAGACAAIAAAVTACAAAGFVPHSVMVQDVHGAGVIDLQILLITTSVTALVLAVVMDERRRSAQALNVSEARYRAIVESQTELVCRNLPDTTLTFVNEAYCRFFGKSREQLIGRKWLELLPQESWAVVRERLAQLSAGSPVMTHEHEVQLPDGGVGWQQWVNTATLDADGHLIEVQGIGRDITELKRVERSLRESDERFRLVLRATNDLIFDWDIARSALWSSAAGGWAEPAATAPWSLERWTAALHEEDRERYLRELEEALRGGGDTWEAEYRCARGGGEMQYVHERAYILRDASGAPIRMIGSASDVSDRKRLEEANQSLTQMARLATVGEIAASIAHEINQPLGAILNNAETALLLLSSSDAQTLPEIREILEDIKKDDQRGIDVIRRLGALLRGRDMRFETLELDQLVNEAASLMRPEARRRHTSMKVQCDSHARVSGDRVNLQQVVLNFVLNSLDALVETPKSQRRILIRTKLDDGAQRVRVTVSDTGCGIAPERLNSVFDSFVTTKSHGMGLGLAIARSIVRAHDGRIWAENNQHGAGATLSFDLLRTDIEAAASIAAARTVSCDRVP